MGWLQGLKCREHDNKSMPERVQKEKALTVNPSQTLPHAHLCLEGWAPSTLSFGWARGPRPHYKIQTDQLYYKRAQLPEDLLIEVSLYDPDHRVRRPLHTLCSYK